MSYTEELQRLSALPNDVLCEAYDLWKGQNIARNTYKLDQIQRLLMGKAKTNRCINIENILKAVDFLRLRLREREVSNA